MNLNKDLARIFSATARPLPLQLATVTRQILFTTRANEAKIEVRGSLQDVEGSGDFFYAFVFAHPSKVFRAWQDGWK